MQKSTPLPAVFPNAGIEAEYRRRLRAIIEEMNASVLYWITARWRENTPATALARDDNPAKALEREMREMSRQWGRNFNAASSKLGKWFAKAVDRRSDKALKNILKDAGISVSFKMTAPMRDVMNATVAAQVGLIKSIPAKYLVDVQGAVMRSVQTGRDLGTLTKEIEKSYGVGRRRAALIARDQNNKATASMTRVRYQEAGLTQAIWMHSGGGKEPRPTHLANSGKKYDVAKGWFDPAERAWVHPGELINCRCVSRAVVPGF